MGQSGCGKTTLLRIIMGAYLPSGGTARVLGELTGNLDPISFGVIVRLIRELNDLLGATSIIVTHDVQEALGVVDYVYFMAAGRVIAQGTPDEIRSSSEPFVNQFVNGKSEGPVPFHYSAPDYGADLEPAAA